MRARKGGRGLSWSVRRKIIIICGNPVQTKARTDLGDHGEDLVGGRVEGGQHDAAAVGPLAQVLGDSDRERV